MIVAEAKQRFCGLRIQFMKQVLNTNGVDRTLACVEWLWGQSASGPFALTAWSSSTAYVQGDIAQTSDNSIWRALQANTNYPPATNASYWAPVDQHGERNVIMRDLYFIGPPIAYPGFEQGNAATDSNFGAYPLVDGDVPISYAPYQAIPNQGFTPIITFQPFSVEKDKLDYKTGFEASALALTLKPRDPTPQTAAGVSISGGMKRGVESVSFNESQSYGEANQVNAPYSDSYIHVAGSIALYQTLRQSCAADQAWYLAPVTVFRSFSPAGSPGDLTSYGCAVMFRGRISTISVDAEDIKIQVASLMEVFKQKVPSQTIQPGNRWAPFNFYAEPNYAFSRSGAGAGSWNWVTIGSSSSPPVAIADGDLAEGWALISNGQGQWWRRIYNNVGSADGTTTLMFLEDLPFNFADSATIGIQAWESGQTGNPSNDSPGQGFPYVPQPLQGQF